MIPRLRPQARALLVAAVVGLPAAAGAQDVLVLTNGDRMSGQNTIGG